MWFYENLSTGQNVPSWNAFLPWIPRLINQPIPKFWARRVNSPASRSFSLTLKGASCTFIQCSWTQAFWPQENQYHLLIAG